MAGKKQPDRASRSGKESARVKFAIGDTIEYLHPHLGALRATVVKTKRGSTFVVFEEPLMPDGWCFNRALGPASSESQSIIRTIAGMNTDHAITMDDSTDDETVDEHYHAREAKADFLIELLKQRKRSKEKLRPDELVAVDNLIFDFPYSGLNDTLIRLRQSLR